MRRSESVGIALGTAMRCPTGQACRSVVSRAE